MGDVGHGDGPRIASRGMRWLQPGQEKQKPTQANQEQHDEQNTGT
jgi:hypothetical protein